MMEIVSCTIIMVHTGNITRSPPPARPHHFSEDIEERAKLYIQGNLQHASAKSLGNHQIHTPVKLYIQGFFKEFRV